MTDHGASARARLLRQVAERIPAPVGQSCVRVAVDGPDGAGKSWFADELAVIVADSGRPVIRVSADSFHNPRAIRYRRGRDSAEGCWLDKYDYDRFRRDVLEPLGPGGSRRYRTAALDLATDTVLQPPEQLAPPGSVLILDGLFLQRDELRGSWELAVFLDVPFEITARRMAARDGSDPDPDHPSLQRYVQAQRRYFASCSPQHRADLWIDNSNVDAPAILRAGPFNNQPSTESDSG